MQLYCSIELDLKLSCGLLRTVSECQKSWNSVKEPSLSVILGYICITSDLLACQVRTKHNLCYIDPMLSHGRCCRLLFNMFSDSSLLYSWDAIYFAFNVSWTRVCPDKAVHHEQIAMVHTHSWRVAGSSRHLLLGASSGGCYVVHLIALSNIGEE